MKNCTVHLHSIIFTELFVHEAASVRYPRYFHWIDILQHWKRWFTNDIQLWISVHHHHRVFVHTLDAITASV